MKPIKTIITLGIAILFSFAPAFALVKELISAKKVDIHFADSLLMVSADIVLDSLDLKSNHQVIITPIVEDTTSGHTTDLPSVLVNGRNMHISYQRGALRNFPDIKAHDICQELRRFNGTRQSVQYAAKIPVEPWMREGHPDLSFRYDPCGCGIASAPEIFRLPVPVVEEEVEVTMQPEMVTSIGFAIPAIDEPTVEIHAGKARIQFEVDRTELHVDPYVCKNGQRIDNRDQIMMIDDSVKYALSDPNVELVGIDICGYASPESPYLHNEELANGRSKALAEYLADRYNIPREKATYSSEPENWGEFREMVEKSDEINDRQRQLLLELIDAPATTPEQYDRKEWLLKTDPKYATLYKTLILPKWFPKLRATTFALRTQLKKMDDEQLAQVFRTAPGRLSLQQFCRLAKLYNSDSDEFNNVVLKALEKYPGNQIAITNAATAAVARGEYDRARQLLDTAEQTPTVNKLRALMAESEHDYEEAARYYNLAGDSEKAEECLENTEN